MTDRILVIGIHRGRFALRESGKEIGSCALSATALSRLLRSARYDTIMGDRLLCSSSVDFPEDDGARSTPRCSRPRTTRTALRGYLPPGTHASSVATDGQIQQALNKLAQLISRDDLVDVAADAAAEPHTHGIWMTRSPNPMPGEIHGAWWWPDGGMYTGTEEDARRVALGACWADRQGRVYEARALHHAEPHLECVKCGSKDVQSRHEGIYTGNGDNPDITPAYCRKCGSREIVTVTP